MDANLKKFVLSRIGNQINLEVCPEYIKKGLKAFVVTRFIFLFVVLSGMTFGGLAFFHGVVLKDAIEIQQQHMALQKKCDQLEREAIQLQDAMSYNNQKALDRLASCGPMEKEMRSKKKAIKNAAQINMTTKNATQTNMGGEE